MIPEEAASNPAPRARDAIRRALVGAK